MAITDEKKANVFCNYFSSVYVVENNAPFDTLQSNETLFSMSGISFDCVDIATRLKKLNINKSEGPDGIHPRVLSENAEILAYHLKIIFKKSFILNALPLDWRSGNIILIVGRRGVVSSTLAFGSIGHGFESEHRLFSHHGASAFS